MKPTPQGRNDRLAPLPNCSETHTAYRGTPIPFAEIETIAGRILNAATRAELAAAVAEYEATAIPDHNTESLRQC